MLWIIAIGFIVLSILIIFEGGGSMLVDWITNNVTKRSKNRYLREYADILVAILVFFLMVLFALLWKG